jgi:hypothetical protein
LEDRVYIREEKLHRQVAEGAKERKSFTAEDAKGAKENNSFTAKARRE